MRRKCVFNLNDERSSAELGSMIDGHHAVVDPVAWNYNFLRRKFDAKLSDELAIPLISDRRHFELITSRMVQSFPSLSCSYQGDSRTNLRSFQHEL